MDYSMPGFLVHHQLLELAQTHVHQVSDAIQLSHPLPSNHLILSHPLLLLLSIFPSIRVLSKESVLRIRWPKYWSFSFSISPSNGYSGLISFRKSFRMDWLDLLTVQGTLTRVFSNTKDQKHQFFSNQLPLWSNTHIHTCLLEQTIAVSRWTFVGKVISLFLNMLSRLVITFLPRSKRLLISWLQSPSAVILEPPKNKVSHCFHCFPIYLP